MDAPEIKRSRGYKKRAVWRQTWHHTDELDGAGWSLFLSERKPAQYPGGFSEVLKAKAINVIFKPMNYQISAHLIPKDYSHRKTSQLFVSGNQSRGQDTATWYASVDSVVSMNLVSSVPYKHCHFNGKCHSFPFLRIPMSTHKLTRSPRHIYTHIHITVVNFSFKILRTPGGSKLLQGLGRGVAQLGGAAQLAQ